MSLHMVLRIWQEPDNGELGHPHIENVMAQKLTAHPLVIANTLRAVANELEKTSPETQQTVKQVLQELIELFPPDTTQYYSKNVRLKIQAKLAEQP